MSIPNTRTTTKLTPKLDTNIVDDTNQHVQPPPTNNIVQYEQQQQKNMGNAADARGCCPHWQRHSKQEWSRQTLNSTVLCRWDDNNMMSHIT